MKHPLVPLLLGIAMLSLLGACQKSDQSSANTSGGNASATSAKAAGKDAVLLKVKWPVGNRYVFRMDLDQHSTNKIPQLPQPMQQDVTMSMTYALSVEKEKEDGSKELALELLANEMEMKMGGQVALTFDSKETTGPQAQSPMLAPFRKMIGTKLHMLLNPDGTVDKVLDIEQWNKNVLNQGGDPMSQMFSQQFNEGFFQRLADVARGLSPQPVRVGQSWPFKMDVPMGDRAKIAVEVKVTLKAWEEREQRHCARLDSNGTLKGNLGQTEGPVTNMSLDHGRVQGSSWFDPELGMIVDSVSDQKMQVKGQFNVGAAPQGAAPNFTSDISQKVTVKLVEVGKNNG